MTALLRRKIKGSKHRDRPRVARLHARIVDTRTDFLCKLSTRLVHENKVSAIGDLNVLGMVKKGRLSRAISGLGW